MKIPRCIVNALMKLTFISVIAYWQLFSASSNNIVSKKLVCRATDLVWSCTRPSGQENLKSSVLVVVENLTI